MAKTATSALESLLNIDEKTSHSSWSTTLLLKALKRLTLSERLDELCEAALRTPGDSHISDHLLKALGIAYALSEEDRRRIPTDGPLIVAANHPFGGVEGVILASILHSARKDARIMANYLLGHVGLDELDRLFIYVDPFARENSSRTNLKPIRETIRWLREGNALGVFPAGEVSHFRFSQNGITDSRWSDTVARIIRNTQASVLPIFFEGRNSILFHLLGFLHPRLRTLMLPRELLNKGNSSIPVKIGKLISFDRLKKLEDEEMMQYVRFRTYMLKNRLSDDSRPVAASAAQNKGLQLPVVAAREAGLLVKEIDALPREQLLVDAGKLAVFSATAWQAPNVIDEIGRLREITFRNAGEGTGKEIDKDRFDEHYLHLFLWDKEKEEVAGAYRLGMTDRILSWYGVEGLYTSTLFDFKEELIERISPAIELGRSFVRTERQKSYQPLMLLWRGIGKFVSEHPQYRFLFGPVSISNDYNSISRQLIVSFSKRSSTRSDLASLVKGKNPPRAIVARSGKLEAACAQVHDILELSELISDIERDQKGIPILLKHYMRLGGELLGFSVDRHFSDVLDALVLVDLAQTETRLLERYMGAEGAKSFLQHHHASLRRSGDAQSDIVDKCA